MTHPYHRTTITDAQAMSREHVIDWLCWNDPNGCYSDDQCAAEGMDPNETDELLDMMIQQIRDSL